MTSVVNIKMNLKRYNHVTNLPLLERVTYDRKVSLITDISSKRNSPILSIKGKQTIIIPRVQKGNKE